ncbi:methyl-accepting chemotaxis protein [Massilia sp. S19_KUP03_FR1]|uniref:methyl-accepting chemotaxis protein n=1 Tax=Massilia sp. S19_KUP03_FR1 TaxID=3025503 RepID=UPI002FCDB498
MKLSNIRIGARLGGAFALVLALMASMIIVGLLELSNIEADKNAMRTAAYKHQLAEQWMSAISTNAVRTFARVKTTNPDDAAFFASEMKAVSARVTEIQNELEPLITSTEGKRLLGDVARTRKTYVAARDAAFKAKAAGAELTELVASTLIPSMKQYIESVRLVAVFQDSLVTTANANIDVTSAKARTLLLGLGALALVLGAGMAVVLTRSITRPLAQAVGLAETVAAGDLTSHTDSSARDEVGQLLRALSTMNRNLLTTVTEVRSGTDTISTAAREIAAGNLDLSSRTEQQASSLQETAASLEELTSTVKQNADNAQAANGLAVSASAVAKRGGTVVAEVVATMASINSSSREIVDIISVIDGIAFQTNILALNAAVEAARAGEQGRGFAVVASEVRNLAQRSAAAAKEIKTLIDNSVRQVEAGGKLVGQAGLTMEEIVASIGSVTSIMSEIAHASAEQTLGIEQINAAITQMDDVTQQNAALVEEAAGAAAQLEEQADALARVVGAFTLSAQPPAPVTRRSGATPDRVRLAAAH